MPSHSVINLHQTYAQFHPNRGFKIDTAVAQRIVKFKWKQPLLKVNLQGENHLHANYFAYSLTIYDKHLSF